MIIIENCCIYIMSKASPTKLNRTMSAARQTRSVSLMNGAKFGRI